MILCTAPQQIIEKEKKLEKIPPDRQKLILICGIALPGEVLIYIYKLIMNMQIVYIHRTMVPWHEGIILYAELN